LKDDQKWLTVCQKLNVTFICLEFVWNVEEDFKPVPDTWIPAKDIEFSNGRPLPDENGHMPGSYGAAQLKWGVEGIHFGSELELVPELKLVGHIFRQQSECHPFGIQEGFVLLTHRK